MRCLAIGLLATFMLSACGENSSSELEEALERIEELEAEAREQDESTAPSSTSSPPPSTTTEPPPSLEDLVETIAADVRTGDCTPGDELLEQYGSELLAAASAQSSDGKSMMMCDLLREVDNWLEVNDRRVKLYLAGTTPPSTPDCDAESGEASLEAFPALYSVLDSRLVYCVSVKADGDTVTFSSRKSNERSAASEGALSFRAEAKTLDWDELGLSCNFTASQIVVGTLFMDYWDFDQCPLHIFLGDVVERGVALSVDSLLDPVGYRDKTVPVAGIYHCPEECLADDPNIEIVEAFDGFIWDRSAGEYDGQELFDLDVALSGLNSALFFYGNAETAIAFNESFLAVHYLISDDVIKSDPYISTAHLISTDNTVSSLLGQGDLNPSIPWQSLFDEEGVTCDDWNLDAIERGSVTSERSCMFATMEVFQFDSSTGPCSFLAQIARSGAEMTNPENLQELVWIDGYSDRVRGSCLIDERVDNGDVAYGLLEPSGTYSYVNGFGATATVPRFNALRVTEYWEG